jgi:hypothetical protein
MEMMVDKVTKKQISFFGVSSIFAANHHPIKVSYVSVINLKIIG